MAKVKRTKNIFNQNIENQSLFNNEQQGQYKVGGVQIKSDWLRDAPPIQFITNIYSSLKLAQLRQQLQKLKHQAINSIAYQDDQISSPTKANLFKIAIIKKKILGFQMDDTGDIHKLQNLVSSNSTFKISQSPRSQRMVIQKLSSNTIALFRKQIIRKCFLVQKQLIVESKKNQDKKQNWLKIDLEKYKMQIDYKVKKSPLQDKNVPSQLSKQTNKVNDGARSEQLQGFDWVDGYDTRILLTKTQNRTFCLYLPSEDVQKLFKYLKFHNFQNNLQKNKSKVFGQLSSQLFQKVITLFGNRLRMYDYNLKLKGTERGGGLDSPLKKFVFSNELSQPQISIQNKSPRFSQIKIADSMNKTIPLKQLTLDKKSELNEQNISQIIQFFPQDARKHTISQIGSPSTFRLRTKKATVYQDQLDSDFNILQLQGQSSNKLDSARVSITRDPMSSPQFRISEINLNLKEQGMSQDDQYCSQKTMVHNRKRTTNLSVSGNIFQPTNQRDWDIRQDPKSKFNINIHQIQSDSDIRNDSNIQQTQNYNRLYHQGSQNYTILPNKQSDYVLPRNSTQSMSSLQLQQIGDSKDLQRHFSQPHRQVSSRTIRTSSSWGVATGKMRLCLRERQHDMKAACYSIEMLYPYHKNTIQFNFLQLDPEIQMQKYKVVCSQTQSYFVQKANHKPKYSLFQGKDGIANFGLNSDSNRFIFVLKQQDNHNFYFNFDINMQEIRYQKDQSQLILIQQEESIRTTNQKSPRSFASPSSFAVKGPSNIVSCSITSINQNKDSYKFAAILRLYISPHQIQIWPQLSTFQFVTKYISMTIYDPHYDFKHNFKDRKMRYHELKDQVNKRCVSNILKCGTGRQECNLRQIVFNGLPEEVVKMLQKKVGQEQSVSKQRIWQVINFSSQLQVKQLKLLQDSILPSKLKNIKMVIKPLQLIQTLLNFRLYNNSLRQRLYQLSLFFMHLSPFTNVIQNIITALSKQILLKLENILINLKSQQQIKAVLKLYLEVQYEIDELFLQVKKYFL